jgi:hypothetical protein
VSNFLSSSGQVERPPAFLEEGEQEEAGPVEAEDLDQVRTRFVRVPDKDSLQYLDPSVTNKALDLLGDALCCVVHDKNDLDRDDLLNATIFVHGKDPEPKVVQIGPRYFVTAGKLTGAAEQTCGLLEVVERSLRFHAFRLDGKVLVAGQVLSTERRTRLSVK